MIQVGRVLSIAILAAFSLTGFSAKAISLKLLANAPLAYLDNDCEGRPCPPTTWFALDAADGFKCRISGFEWNEITGSGNSWKSKNDFIVELTSLSTFRDWREVGSACVKYHPENPKLCVLKSYDYKFVTSFTIGAKKTLSCENLSDSDPGALSPQEIYIRVMGLKSPWLKIQPQ